MLCAVVAGPLYLSCCALVPAAHACCSYLLLVPAARTCCLYLLLVLLNDVNNGTRVRLRPGTCCSFSSTMATMALASGRQEGLFIKPEDLKTTDD